MLVYELYENQTMASLLYPVNVMRNLARLMARTPIMGAIDVDMMVGGELADELATNATAAVDLVRRVMGNTTRGREAAERAERGTVAVTALYAAVPAERSKVRADRAAAEARAAAAVERARELFSAQAVGPAPGPLERAAPSSVGLITSRRESTSARRLLRGVPGLQKLGGRRRRRTTEEQLDGEGYGDDEGEDGREGSEELGEVQDGEDEAAAGVPAASGAALEPALTSTGSVADSPPTTSASPDAAAATSTGSSPSAPSFPANGRVAVVLPAFTTDWRLRSDLNAPTLLAEGLALRPTNKTLLREWFNAWHFWRFAPKRKAHLSTDTEKWLETDEWYEVKANDNAMYEPWVLVDRLTSPWHDIRFRGYGMNKVMHLYHLNGLGYQLQVHPRAYLVHRPHRQTKARLSVGRLAQLEALCRSWAGPLAAAVWLPLVLKGKNGSSGKSSNVTYSLGTIDDGGLKLSDNHRNVISREAAVINALHQRAEQAGPCQLDLMLVYELYESDKMASLLYPVNVMRNLARLMARTPMMGAFDADMMVGGELADELATNATAAVDLVRRVMGNTTRGREAAERAERGAVAGAALYAVTAAERAKARAAEAAAEAQAAEARAAAAQARVKELQSRTASGAGAGAATAARRLLRGLPSLLKLSRWHQRSTQGSDGEDDGEEEGDGDDGEDGGEEGEGQQEDEDEDDGDAMSAEVSAAEAALEAALAAATGSDPTPSSSSTSPSASTSTPASATSGAASTGAKPSSAQGHPTDGRVAVVLPAFTTDWKMTSDQTWPTELAETLALRSTNKTLLSKWYKIKSLRRFNPKGSTHHNTDTSRWLKTHEWYNVSYRFMYEPWVLVDRLTSPWHDIRFRGYGMNKVMHLYHLNGLGYQLQVHPRAYLVHRPHRQTTARLKHNRDQTDKGLRGRANHLSAVVREAVKKGSYEPWIDTMTLACRQSLPWWQEGPWAQAA